MSAARALAPLLALLAAAPPPPAAGVRAARESRLRAAQLEARAAEAAPDAAPGASAAELFAAAGRESARCAEEARAAWSQLAPAAAAALAAGTPERESLRSLPAAAAEPLYLEAVCAADAARVQGTTQLDAAAPGLRARLERAAELAPDLDGAGPERALAALLAELPAAAGGDVAEARARFQLALARAPGSIETRVLFARTVAVKQQDRALFEALLARALSSPAAAPEARAAQALARALLAREDELFGPPPAPPARPAPQPGPAPAAAPRR